MADIKMQNDFFIIAIRKKLEEEIEIEVSKAIEEAKAKIEKRIPEITAGLAIRLMTRVSMEQRAEKLHISVDMKPTERE
jgi:hypothetical protein